jgi:hypothetical protein
MDRYFSIMMETMEQSFLATCIELGYFDMLRSNHSRSGKALLAANIKDRQWCQQKFKEHQRNNVWRNCLVKAITINGCFMKRYKMTETASTGWWTFST